MDYSTIMNMLQGQLNNDPSKDFVSTATTSINNQTKKRVKDMLSKYSTTGMGRTGISGAATNDIYSNAGEQIANVGAQGEQMAYNNKMGIIQEMLKTQQLDDQPSALGSILGKLLSTGLTVGGGLIGGPAGAMAGSALGGALGSGFGNSSTPDPTNGGMGKFGFNGYR